MIYIIGGNGFVGSAFTRLCVSRGREHRVVTRENADQLAGSSCRLLVNANGNSRKFLASRDPIAEFDASVRTVRRSLVDFRAETYLHLSSCDVYPDCSSPGTTREDSTEPVAGGPGAQSPYGFHKHLAEQCVRHAHPRHIILRMGGFVGPGLKKNAIFDILKGGPLFLHPDSQLQFMPTDELARIAMDLAEHQADDHVNRVYNVCGRGVVRLADVAAWCGRTDIEVASDAPRVRYEVSIERLARWYDPPSTAESVRAFLATPDAAEIASAHGQPTPLPAAP